MKISFGNGMVYLDNKQKYINPDKIISISNNQNGGANVFLEEGIVYETELPASKIASACIKAQNEAAIIQTA